MAKNSLKNVRGAERSAYFARREAANVLRCVLKGDAERRAAASIKSLVYKPSVRNKKATFALVCQTLKYLPILKKVLADTNLVSCKWKRQAELIYVVTYDIMFGQDVVSVGHAENFVRSQKNSLQTALARICMKENVKSPRDLLPKDNKGIDLLKPRFVRVNTLRVDMECALQTLQKTTQVRAILLDPSCSGSGTSLQRLDHLLPSHAAGHGKDTAEVNRINNLASFQRKALLHALSFPTVERIVYSTCSIHQIENEDVISSVLPHAHALNFRLETLFPEWAHRGLPVFGGAKHLLRTDGAGDMEGFFIALFVRRREKLEHLDSSEKHQNTHTISAETETSKLYNALMTKERPIKDFDASHLKPKLPSKKGTMITHQRSIKRKGFGIGTPKMFHLLHTINYNKMKSKQS